MDPLNQSMTQIMWRQIQHFNKLMIAILYWCICLREEVTILCLHDHNKPVTITHLYIISDLFHSYPPHILYFFTVSPLHSSCELSKMHTWIPSALGSLCVLLLTILSSTMFYLLSLLQAATLFACSVDASTCMPAGVLCYCTFQGIVL